MPETSDPEIVYDRECIWPYEFRYWSDATLEYRKVGDKGPYKVVREFLMETKPRRPWIPNTPMRGH